MADIPLPMYGTDPQCDGCGACCLFMEWPPYKKVERIAPEASKEIQDAIDAGQDRHMMDCLFLDGKLQCKHYDDRPEACKRFEVNGHHCTRVRATKSHDARRENRFIRRDLTDVPGDKLWNGTGTTADNGTKQGSDVMGVA